MKRLWANLQLLLQHRPTILQSIRFGVSLLANPRIGRLMPTQEPFLNMALNQGLDSAQALLNH